MSVSKDFSGGIRVWQDQPLHDRFAAAATTADILNFAAVLQAGVNIDSAHTSVPSWREVKNISALCVKLAENQQRQDRLIADLRKRLATVESEFNPQRPLRGKDDLTPQPPSG